MKTVEISKHKNNKKNHNKNYFLLIARWILVNIQLKKASDDTISVEDIINLIASKAFYFVILIFSFPVALPLPYPPGFPSICAIPIFLLSFQMVINKKTVILPRFIRDYRLKISFIRMVISKSDKIFRILSKIIYPGRLSKITSDKITVLYGILFLALSICILIPFPGTNFVPAVGIFIASLGLLFKDGLLAIIGTITGLIGIIFVYFFAAIFANLIGKFFRFTYNKISNLYLDEGTFMMASGILIGCISMLVLYLIVKLILKIYSSKKKNSNTKN
jgi:hypothetical protein